MDVELELYIYDHDKEDSKTMILMIDSSKPFFRLTKWLIRVVKTIIY